MQHLDAQDTKKAHMHINNNEDIAEDYDDVIFFILGDHQVSRRSLPRFKGSVLRFGPPGPVFLSPHQRGHSKA
jgi:hypothetical protein